MIPVLFSGLVMYNCLGGVEGIVRVAQDISDLKKAELELKAFADRLSDSNKELVDFAHVASRDLQEPLRKVTAFAGRLRKKCGESLE